MKKFLIAATALSGLLAFIGSASAADIAPMPEAYDWTGPYIGIQGGYGWGDTEPTYDDSVGFAGSLEVDYEGFIGGIEAGYNWQSNNLVLGIETDASFSDINGDALDLTGVSPPCIIVGQGCSADVDWLATGRLRLGYAIDRLMPFITGGIAVGGVKGTFDSPGNACTCDVDDTTIGWTVGGGVEWAVSDSWSVKAEYLYVDLGKPSISGDNTLGAPGPGVGTDNYDFSIARLGVNFNF
jgi:outer membrane immunogenic protein